MRFQTIVSRAGSWRMARHMCRSLQPRRHTEMQRQKQSEEKLRPEFPQGKCVILGFNLNTLFVVAYRPVSKNTHLQRTIRCNSRITRQWITRLSFAFTQRICPLGRVRIKYIRRINISTMEGGPLESSFCENNYTECTVRPSYIRTIYNLYSAFKRHLFHELS